MEVIYTPKGRAFEYAPLAINLRRGCTHGCHYCYGPEATRMAKEEFHASSMARKGIVEAVRAQAPQLRGDPREILVSFTGDCYDPSDQEEAVTRQVLEILAENQCRATVLTKGGTRAVRDFDVLAQAGFRFGTTLVFSNDDDRAKWEPKAAPTADRIEAIKEAKRRGIPTWVSLEPVVFPDQTLRLISTLLDEVNIWKVGKMNHMPDMEAGVDWKAFLASALQVLDANHKTYYVKDDLWSFADVEIRTRYKKTNIAGLHTA